MTSNQEDYLEAIHKILQEKPVVRPKEIAEELDVSKPSVTSALQTLAREGLVNYEPYGLVTLTEAGENQAKFVFQKHRIICEFFERIIGIEPGEAEEQACMMEHGLNRHTLRHLIQFMRYQYEQEGGKDQWLRRFSSYCDEHPLDDLDPDQVEEYLHNHTGT